MENTMFSAIDSLKPGLKMLEGTINKFDVLVCKSLDIMEQQVPHVYLPPQMMYWNTKEYMSDRLVRPVIKRANSFKDISQSLVLDSKVSNFAAGRLDNALNVADMYVEKYLPQASEKEENDDDEDAVDCKFQVQVSSTHFQCVIAFPFRVCYGPFRPSVHSLTIRSGLLTALPLFLPSISSKVGRIISV